jgi:hypothetical protein
MEFKSGNALIYFKIELSGIDENVGWSKDFLFLCMCVMHTHAFSYMKHAWVRPQPGCPRRQQKNFPPFVPDLSASFVRHVLPF